MVSSLLSEEILHTVEQLPPEQQQQVLDFVRSLIRPVARHGTDVMHLAGSIAPDDLAIMGQVADEDCERVYPEAW